MRDCVKHTEQEFAHLVSLAQGLRPPVVITKTKTDKLVAIRLTELARHSNARNDAGVFSSSVRPIPATFASMGRIKSVLANVNIIKHPIAALFALT